MSDTRPAALVETLSALVNKHAFFASYLYSRMRVEHDPGTQTASTDGRTIRVGDWFLAQPPDERLFVLAHEVLHGVFDHMPRAASYESRGFGPDVKPFSRDKFGRAADYVINAVLKDARVGKMPADGLYDTKYGPGAITDEVYAGLGDEPEDQDGKGPGGGHGGFDEHLLPEPGADGADTPADHAQAVTRALATAKAMGQLPGALERLLSPMVESKEDWKSLLWDYVTAVAGQDEVSWATLHRRKRALSPHVPYPGRTGHALKCAVIAIDTSGSISDAEAAEFIGETAAIMEQLAPEELHILWWDTVPSTSKSRTWTTWSTCTRVGGGGTDYRCVPSEDP